MYISPVESQLTPLDLHHYKDAWPLVRLRRAVHPARPAAMCFVGGHRFHGTHPSAGIATPGERQGTVE